MSTDYLKRYFKKIKGRFETVNKQDPFFDSFTKAIESGENTLFQKHLLETRVFDGTWVDYIEENLSYLDNIIRNPRSFIRSVDEVVPVERAKKTNSDTVRYLASHSQDIRSIDKRGEIVPRNLLTSFKEEDLGIYENRFIKSLVEKLVIFIEKRYNGIKELIGTDYINKFYYKSNYNYDDINIDLEINLNASRKIHHIDAELKNNQLLDRVELVRSKIIAFLNSQFFNTLKSVRPITPPIQRTNILMKDPNYHKCYEMWLFLDSYGKLDYSIETSMADSLFKDDYLKSIYELNLLSFATVAANDQDEHGQYSKIPSVPKKIKKPKILNKYDPDEVIKDIQIESHLINEYYYQQSRKLYSQRINDLVNDGETFHAALQDVYQSAFKITERLFNDLLEIPEEIKNDPKALLRYRMRNQKALDQIYKYKASDLAKMEKARIKNNNIIEKEKFLLEGKVVDAPKVDKTVLKIQEKANELKLKEKEINKKLKELEKEKATLDLLISKENEKINQIKAKEKEKEEQRIAKEKEKQRLAREKEKEKERLAREKEKDKERLAREKEKEKERLARQKEKEKLKNNQMKNKALADEVVEFKEEKKANEPKEKKEEVNEDN